MHASANCFTPITGVDVRRVLAVVVAVTIRVAVMWFGGLMGVWAGLGGLHGRDSVHVCVYVATLNGSFIRKSI